MYVKISDSEKTAVHVAIKVTFVVSRGH